MSYTDLADALARAKERSGATATDDTYLTELLQMSAAPDGGGTTHFRPFFAAAKWLEQNRTQQAISEADGAKFTGLATPIESLLALQYSYDQANGLTVPAGFEAVALDCVQCDGAAAPPVTRRVSQSVGSCLRP
ncbi:MAG: hypothetical protein F6J95_023620 [Leptolyngbya sp. SIO1E4]|nr:hypothetical protein [Leptolyngbya sp. SIO1E4]